MTDSNAHCDVCGKEVPTHIEAVASAVAPVSYLRCHQCSELGAEPIGLITLWMASLDEAEFAAAPQSKLVSYVERGYRHADEIVAYFEENEERIRGSFRAEFGQVGMNHTAIEGEFDLDDRDD